MSRSESTTGDAAPAAPVHEDEGQTPAAWTACGGIIAASLVAAAAVILGSIPLTVAAIAVAVAGLVAGSLMGRASRARREAQQVQGGGGAGADDPHQDAQRRAGMVSSGGRPGDGPYDRESDDD